MATLLQTPALPTSKSGVISNGKQLLGLTALVLMVSAAFALAGKARPVLGQVPLVGTLFRPAAVSQGGSVGGGSDGGLFAGAGI